MTCLMILRGGLAAQTTNLRPVAAADGSFTVQLPPDWYQTSSTLEAFQAWSRRGETVFSRVVTVPIDDRDFQRLLAKNHVPEGARRKLPVMTSPPLSPTEIIQTFLPRASGGAMQNVECKGVQEIVSPDGANRAALVHYTYDLYPHSLDESSLLAMPPVLSSQIRVRREAVALVYTAQPIRTHGFSHWTFSMRGADAAPAVFKRKLPLYSAILRSLRYNQTLTAAKAPASNHSHRKLLIGAVVAAAAVTTAVILTHRSGESLPRNVAPAMGAKPGAVAQRAAASQSPDMSNWAIYNMGRDMSNQSYKVFSRGQNLDLSESLGSSEALDPQW
jgi:hypothetical protein